MCAILANCGCLQLSRPQLLPHTTRKSGRLLSSREAPKGSIDPNIDQVIGESLMKLLAAFKPACNFEAAFQGQYNLGFMQLSGLIMAHIMIRVISSVPTPAVSSKWSLSVLLVISNLLHMAHLRTEYEPGLFSAKMRSISGSNQPFGGCRPHTSGPDLRVVGGKSCNLDSCIQPRFARVKLQALKAACITLHARKSFEGPESCKHQVACMKKLLYVPYSMADLPLPAATLSLFTKRRRAFVACAGCRKRKIKCVKLSDIDNAPCTRCALKGIKCEYGAVTDDSSASQPSVTPPQIVLEYQAGRIPAGENTRPTDHRTAS
ncbi:hypothetical protein DFH06DRAFT_1123494 [Mycena polygramma]|nr:hypothetical protein DFH06DRAFT_1123494 [Mycena polygramma]